MSNLQKNTELEVFHIEHHLHNRQKWFGLAAVPSGELHVADKIGPGILPFQLISGSDDWGSWVQVLGTNDTPVITDSTVFDSRQLHVTDTDSTSTYAIQVAAGESADLATAVANNLISEIVYSSPTSQNDSGPTQFSTPQIPAGTKVWARTICIGEITKFIKIYFPIHEYSR